MMIECDSSDILKPQLTTQVFIISKLHYKTTPVAVTTG